MADAQEVKLERFLQWLQLNKVELRGSSIKYSGSNKGFGIFSSNDVCDGILLVVPLDLIITPMRVLQDPLLGPHCRAMFEEEEVDDRFLIILFLMVERLRKNSSWKSYFDILPTEFGNPLWFSDDELSELKGTTLYQATDLQRQKLQYLFHEKVKKLAEKLLTLDGCPESEVSFEDFLWANSIFWSRAQNIPLPHSYVFPKNLEGKEPVSDESAKKDTTVASKSGEDTVWVEGIVPGIDFCNHGVRATATWEVDATGLTTGTPFSMYLLSVGEVPIHSGEEILISYGNKGNEELLYLYGFVMEDNPDDYLMVHYPVGAIQGIAFAESKSQLLEAQKAELRCLLPRTLLKDGFFPPCMPRIENNDKSSSNSISAYSWSGERKMPSYLNRLVFPEDFLTALRTIAMKDDELYKVTSLLTELVGPGGQRQPSDAEVRAAIWEACGDSGALQVLVDLLNMKMTELEEGSGREENDAELLRSARSIDNSVDYQSKCDNNGTKENKLVSRNRWCSIVYRHGQKQLTSLFLKEAEHALQLALSEGN
nr:ribosomal lysine N-methyltransferase set10-like [Ipomoea batatas]